MIMINDETVYDLISILAKAGAYYYPLVKF